MKFKGLDNVFYQANSKNSVVQANDSRPRSALHKTARSILKSTFPTINILEEVGIKIDMYKNAYLDFLIPMLSIVVEVHGQQHYKFNSLFHRNAQDFARQKKRDKDLIEWCEVNNLTYIELPYNESEEKWKQRISNL